MPKLYFLGPKGTYSQMACEKFLTKLVGAFLGLSMVASVGTVIGVESAKTSAMHFCLTYN